MNIDGFFESVKNSSSIDQLKKINAEYTETIGKIHARRNEISAEIEALNNEKHELDKIAPDFGIDITGMIAHKIGEIELGISK